MEFTITADRITEQVCSAVKRANFFLPPDVFAALKRAREEEVSETAASILGILIENAVMAGTDMLPVCQDTGIDAVFVEMGSRIRVDGDLYEAIHRGVARGTREGFLRASVCDPVSRRNTGDNTPAVVHIEMVEGARFKMTVLPKGCGSENMSRLAMLPPSAGIEGVTDFVVDCVRRAGPNPCPPGMVGVGIGGTMEMAALLAKKALLRPVGQASERAELAELEKELLHRINGLGIGPHGLGGRTTALSVAVETYPCHIASLPVAVNIQCHAARMATALFEDGRWKDVDGTLPPNMDMDAGESGLSADAMPVKLPLDPAVAASLRAGQWVRLSGRMLTGRDQTHRRLCEIIKAGGRLPVDLSGQLIYYVGPSPTPAGRAVGSAGPTTSYRMDAYTPAILEQGVLGLMGKGKRSRQVREEIRRHGAVYLATIGGAGAYLSRSIERASVVAFEDLGPEAMYEFVVKDFPAVVINDSLGQDYYEMVQDGR